MPFMPAVSLNQWSGALPKRGIRFSVKVFLPDSLLPPLSVFACSAVQSLLAFGKVCCPNASLLYAARF